MRIIHISDLHIGKKVNEFSMLEEQKRILSRIVEISVEKKAQVMIIAGDVYDRTIPPVEAVEIFDDFLTKLVKINIKVMVIAGNHDSSERLSFANRLIENAGVYIEGEYKGNVKKVTLKDTYGNINFFMVPYIKPSNVRQYFDEEIASYDDAFRCIIGNTDINKKERNIIIAHQFFTGSGNEVERCDSETITVGGLDNIDVSVLNDFDYGALGHIHGPQKLTKENIRYSGTPLKYSFSEKHHKKSLVFIDAKEKGNIKTELVLLQPNNDLKEIKGKLEEVLDTNNFTDINKDDYLSVILTDDEIMADAYGKLSVRFNRVMQVHYDNIKSLRNENAKMSVSGDIETMTDLELFNQFYKNQMNVDMDDERIELVKEVIKKVGGRV